MRALAIDFGRRPVRGLRTMRLVLACAALACTTLALERLLAYRSEADAWHLALDEQAAAGNPAADQATDGDDVKGRLKYAVRMREAIDAPWEALFLAIEAMASSDIALLSLSTDAASGDIVLTADARDVGAMHLYTQQIGAAQELTQVYLATHQVQIENARHPVLFSINASWARLRNARAPAASQSGSAR